MPVFLPADRKRVKGSITIEVAEMVDEFVWLLEDTADFVAGRVMAAIQRYQAQLLPPYARALAEYSQLREHSWSAPGHQGGIAFTKLPAGRAFFDFIGENLFRTDMGIERGALGSLLDHTGPVADSEKYAARVFGAHRSYSGVVGTSGSNRSIMQACMKRGRPGRPRPQLPQVDRAGPDADRRAPGLHGAHAQPLRHHRPDLAVGDGSRRRSRRRPRRAR